MGDNGRMEGRADPDVRVVVDEDGVIRLDWTAGITITEQAAQRAADYVNELSADRRRPMIVNMAETAAVTRAARTVFLKAGAASMIALLGRSPVDRVIANFILGVSNLPCPTRFFTGETAALAWIAQQSG